MPTLDIYCRISADHEGAGLGVARQEKDCRAHLVSRGLSCGEVLIDNDISGYSRKARPGYQAMLQRIRDGVSDGFVVWHLDRLTRHPAELEEVIEVVEARAALVLTVTGGAYDLSTTDGRAMARVVGVFARKESEDKARRNKRKHLELAQAGRPVGGTRHFGYEPLYRDGEPVLLDNEGHPTLAVRADEAALIREAVDSVLAGESVRSIVRRWNDAGLVAPRGGRFTASAVQRILRSPTIAGWRALDRVPVAPGRWEAIIDRDVQRRLEAILDTRRGGPGRFAGTKPRTYLLSGLLVCARCGTSLVAQARPDRKRSYTCPSDPSKTGCGGVRIVAPDLEAEVFEQLLIVMDARELAAAAPPADDPTGPLLDELARLEADQAQLAADHYADRLIDRAQFFAASEALSVRLAAVKTRVAAEAQRSAVTPMLDDLSDLAEQWDGLALGKQRAIVERFVDRIVIHPSTVPRGRFSADRVEVIWRS